LCLLELDEAELAILHLREAAQLDPAEPLHQWNLAAAAKREGRMGGCYLALREYLRLDDQGRGAGDRQKEARSFVRAYERTLREVQQGVSLKDVLRGEEWFARAYAALSEGRHDEARRYFEKVIALEPGHYPSWGSLGVAYLALQRRDEALRCLRRALELNPEYGPARQNLALLDELR
jgi:tetratricopeptide (TPR) repeat protein